MLASEIELSLDEREVAFDNLRGQAFVLCNSALLRELDTLRRYG